MRSAGFELLLAAHWRGSKPAQTVALPSFVGSSALALTGASAWSPENAGVADPNLVGELEAPAVAENEDRSKTPASSTDP